MLLQRLFRALHHLVIQIEIVHSIQDNHKVSRRLNILPQGLAYTRLNIADVIEDSFSRVLVITGEQFAKCHGQVGFTRAIAGNRHDKAVAVSSGYPIRDHRSEANGIHQLMLSGLHILVGHAIVSWAVEDIAGAYFIRKMRIIEPLRLNCAIKVSFLVKGQNIINLHLYLLLQIRLLYNPESKSSFLANRITVTGKS